MSEHRLGELEKKVDDLRVQVNKFGRFWSKQWKISYIMFFLLAGIMCFVTIIFLAVPTENKLTTNNTKEYTATISKIQPLPFFGITVDEHHAVFIVYPSDIVLDFDALATLSVGQTIVFRIHKDDIVKLGKMTEQILFASLSVEGTEIITLKSVNKYIEDDRYVAIPLAIFAVILLVLGIVFRKQYVKKFKEYQGLKEPCHVHRDSI